MLAKGRGILPARAIANSQSDPKVKYFAFGANVNSATFQRRGVSYIEKHPARIHGEDIWLAFVHSGGFASLVSRRWAQSIPNWFQWPDIDSPESSFMYHKPYGLLYTMTKRDLDILIEREIGYTLNTNIEVQNLDTGQIETAFAFVSSPWLLLKSPVRPTERYLGLILSAAKENAAFAEDYVSWLATLETIDKKQLASREYSATATEFVARVLGACSLAALGAAFLH